MLISYAHVSVLGVKIRLDAVGCDIRMLPVF